MNDEAANLARLSAAATQGEWAVGMRDAAKALVGGCGEWVAILPNGHREWYGLVSDAEIEANAAFIATLANLYRSGRLVLLPSVDEMAGGNTLPAEYVRWLSSIDDDVRVHDLTADEVARLTVSLTERTGNAN